jgi:fucose 4-O-acetylase-like acetyltransferase
LFLTLWIDRRLAFSAISVFLSLSISILLWSRAAIPYSAVFTLDLNHTIEKMPNKISATDTGTKKKEKIPLRFT